MREYFVYILRCSDGTYYTGITNDIERRFEEHSSGMHEDCYTFERRPVRLVYSTAFRDVRDAIHFEKVVKDWSRKKRDALVRGDFEALRLLAKKKFPPRYKRKVASMLSLLREVMAEMIWDCVE